MKTYSVKEIFYSLQGEGANAGTPAVFCRFAGCNLWSGREDDREKAVCNFCDTDFLGGEKFVGTESLVEAVKSKSPAARGSLLVCTGGEPLLQLDTKAIQAFKQAGFVVAIETNGTVPAPPGLDWICVSPKAGAPFVQRSGNELKIVFPQKDLEPEQFEGLDFDHFFLQPMDGPAAKRNTQIAIEYCLSHPQWRLSLQTHKLLGLR